MSENPAEDPDAADDGGAGRGGSAAADASSSGAATGDDSDDPFADVVVTDVDEDEVWRELEDGDGEVDGDLFERLAEENPVGDVEPEVHTDGETAIVPKSKYCQRCEYFSAPPDVTCGHPGTTIAEVVDTDNFEVRNCPVVAERSGASDVLDAE